MQTKKSVHRSWSGTVPVYHFFKSPSLTKYMMESVRKVKERLDQTEKDTSNSSKRAYAAFIKALSESNLAGLEFN